MPSTYESPLPSNILIIHEGNFHEHAENVPANMSRGRIPRDYRTHPVGHAWKGASAFTAELNVPREEWDERIEEMERNRTGLDHLVDQVGLECKDQNGTNFCWDFATTHCCEIELVKANQKDPQGNPVKLSPASTACKIKNFRNQGGWGQEALEYQIEHGTVPEWLWPQSAINRQYDTAANWKEAEKYRVKEWMDIASRNFGQKCSAQFHRLPTSDGYNWWSHQVTGYRPVIIAKSIVKAAYAAAKELYKLLPTEYREPLLEKAASKYGTLQRNSWSMSYGDRGYFILAESKATPDDCCSPSVLLPS